MDAQASIEIFGEVVNLAIDVAGMAPFIGIPVNFLHVIQDGIAIEKTVYAILETTPQGKEILGRIDDIAARLGLAKKRSPEGHVTFTVAQTIGILEAGNA